MKRRTFLAAAAGALLNGAANSEQQRPNVVLILVDDLGWADLGCQGSTFYETPNIDRLAGNGVRFTDAYANCPVCSPSRAALLTGRYPARVHFTGHITAIGRHRYPLDGRIIPPKDLLYLAHDEITIAEVLKASGYVSASIGKWHLGPPEYWPEHHGFDVNVAGYDQGSPPSYFYPYKNPKLAWNPEIPTLKGGEAGEYLTDRLTDEAIHFIEQNKKSRFFLYLAHYAVHTPLQAPLPAITKYQQKMKRDHSQISAPYAAMVEAVDRGVGRLMATLDRLELTSNTLVIIASDNGGEMASTRNLPLRAGKGTLYEGGIRVPLILHWPGRLEAGKVRHEPVMLADLYPTILSAVSVKLPSTLLDGVNLWPALSTDKIIPQRDLYFYYPHYLTAMSHPGSALRAGSWKLIDFYDPPHLELYNLAADVSEAHDVASKHPEIAQQMKRKIDSSLQSVGTIMYTLNPNYRELKGHR